jgi:hypothetical protein
MHQIGSGQLADRQIGLGRFFGRLIQKSCEMYHAGNGGGAARAKNRVRLRRREKENCYTIGNSVL